MPAGLPDGYKPVTAGLLGLAMVNMLVEQMDGTISFSSENGTKESIINEKQEEKICS